MKFFLVLAVCLCMTGVQVLAAAPKSVAPEMVGGAKPGMKYGAVRTRLLKAGFKPVPRQKGEFCGYNDECKLPETEACAGTGEAYCTYRFSKGRRILQITGRNGEEGNTTGQEVVIIEFTK